MEKNKNGLSRRRKIAFRVVLILTAVVFAGVSIYEGTVSHKVNPITLLIGVGIAALAIYQFSPLIDRSHRLDMFDPEGRRWKYLSIVVVLYAWAFLLIVVFVENGWLDSAFHIFLFGIGILTTFVVENSIEKKNGGVFLPSRRERKLKKWSSTRNP